MVMVVTPQESLEVLTREIIQQTNLEDFIKSIVRDEPILPQRLLKSISV